MNLFGMLELSGSALGAERQRAEVVASNMANLQTTRTAAGGPYRRQLVIFQAQHVPRFSLALAGLHRETASAVRVAAVVSDQRPPVLPFEPGHPDPNPQGYVAYPPAHPLEDIPHLLAPFRPSQLNSPTVQ